MLGLVRAATAAFVTAFAITISHAQSPAEFYRGKNVEIYIGYSVGGGYDLYARLLARHIGKHIPGNPTVVAKNMEAPRVSDSPTGWRGRRRKTGPCSGPSAAAPRSIRCWGQKGAQFTGTDFNWIGSANDEVSICVAWGTSNVSRFEDLLTKELTIGGTGASDDTVQFAKVLNNVLGTRLKIVTGYPGGNDITLAMERREVDGRCGWSWTSVKANHPTWVAEKKINVLVQLALGKHPDLPNVPLITDLATTAEQAQVLKLIFARQVMGRPFLSPPDVPKDRVAALRQAFMDTMNDKDFRADADRTRLEITPVPGDRVQALVQELYRTPAAVAQKAAAALN